MKPSCSHNNNLLLLILIIAAACCCFTITTINATKSECFKPSDSGTEKRRGPRRVVSSHSDSEELVNALRFFTEKQIYQPSYAVGGPRYELIENKVVKAMSSKAKQYISHNPTVFNSVTGPTNLVLDKEVTFVGKEEESCVACRLTCLDLNVFEECRDQYYYYGCRQKDECYNKESADKTVIQTAIGICIDKNGCKLKKGPKYVPKGVEAERDYLLKYYMEGVINSSHDGKKLTNDLHLNLKQITTLIK